MKVQTLVVLLLAVGLRAQLQVFPRSVQLDDARDRQRVVAWWRAPGGACADRTAAAQWRLQPLDLAAIETGSGTVRLRPLRDGEGVLIASADGAEVRVPVRTRNAAASPPISFQNDIVAILTRSGCNQGSCHGAAAGKNGFGLSLFGFDPARDLRTLTRDLRGRRLDPAEPAQSLMLQKATNAVAHKGGLRVQPDSDYYGELRDWIAAGAPSDLGKAPALAGIELLPGDAVLEGRGQRLPFLLRAHYADGSDRDVTALALWSSSNDAACSIDKQGMVTSGDPGESCVLARFGPCAQAVQVLVLPAGQAFTWPDVPEVNFVDQLVHAKLRRTHVLPAEPCSDAVFVRRVHLDLLNVLPTAAESQAFCQDADPEKRSKLVDALLQRPEFAAAMAMSWAEVLQVDAQTMEPKGASLLHHWLQDAFAQGRPFDQVVREMLTAEGSSFSVPPANFLLTAQQPNLLAEKVAQNFLGIRLQCAQCHNHPFENWTMDDYYGFAAFFAWLGRKRGEDPYESLLWNRGGGEVNHKRDGSVVPPRYLGGGPAKVPAGTDRRQVLADWLCSPDNPYFARNVVNRLWARLFGRGIVDPPDDVRVSNPPSHPELLQALAALLVESHFDVRPVVRAICNSRTYQSGRHPDAPPAALFAGNLVRRLSAEQLLDAISAVTGVPTRYPGVPLGEPATEIAAGNSNVRFLDLFGRPMRESACTCDRRDEPTLGQTLHLINGDTIANKIADGNGRLKHALAVKQEPGAMLDDLFLAAYSRLPSDGERERMLGSLGQGKDAAAAWQDIYWAVLNSKEFTFQH